MLRMMDHFDYQRARSIDLDRERKKWFIAAKDRREKKEVIKDREEEQLADLATAMELATEAQIDAFEVKLDAYDVATTKALMHNQEALDAVNLQIQSLLLRAHQLEDGRRIFKTEDGTQVFDEHGNEVGADIILPEAISNDRPNWESYQAQIEARESLTEERNSLHEYQDKLDEARDAARSGELTQQELDDLDADLQDTMPPSVAKHLPDELKPEVSTDVSKLKADYGSAVSPETATNLQPTVPIGLKPLPGLSPVN
ncbi:MAG: hypothetical protein AAGK79_16035 [Pseudomonadota bacterium]